MKKPRPKPRLEVPSQQLSGCLCARTAEASRGASSERFAADVVLHSSTIAAALPPSVIARVFSHSGTIRVIPCMARMALAGMSKRDHELPAINVR
jgi:hypothetical protein